MFGWIERPLLQVTGKLDVQFDGISVMLVGDFAQLLPVTDKPPYHSTPSGNIALMGYLRYRSMKTVVKLTENQRVSSTYQQRFRDFLIYLRNGDNTLEDWFLFYSFNISKFNVSSINNTPGRLPYTNSVVAENSY